MRLWCCEFLRLWWFSLFLKTRSCFIVCLELYCLCLMLWIAIMDQPDTKTYGADLVGVHPKTLFEKVGDGGWAFGGFAHLIDNTVDAGSTNVSITALRFGRTTKTTNPKMLKIQDNGDGMTRPELQECMSIGISTKIGKIGEYGLGFNIGTSRLGADTLVFTRSRKSPEICTIGLLSFTYLKKKNKNYTIVPMLNYINGELQLSETIDKKNFDIICTYSPFDDESKLIQQVNLLNGVPGTIIVIWNLWNVNGQRELDFETNIKDIRIRQLMTNNANVRRNCKQLSSYKHSFRSYASLLYRNTKLQIFLRGHIIRFRDIESNLESLRAFPTNKDNLKVGFLKCGHIPQLEGINLYWRNRLIKAFWKFYQSKQIKSGIIGVLEVDFLKPSEDKQNIIDTPIAKALKTKLMKLLIEFSKHTNGTRAANPQKSRDKDNHVKMPNKDRSNNKRRPRKVPAEVPMENTCNQENTDFHYDNYGFSSENDSGEHEDNNINTKKMPNEDRSNYNRTKKVLVEDQVENMPNEDRSNYNRTKKVPAEDQMENMPNKDLSNYNTRRTKKVPSEDQMENETDKSSKGKGRRRARKTDKSSKVKVRRRARKTDKQGSNEVTENRVKESEELLKQLEQNPGEQEELPKQLEQLSGEQEELPKQLEDHRSNSGEQEELPKQLEQNSGEREELQKQLEQLSGEQDELQKQLEQLQDELQKHLEYHRNKQKNIECKLEKIKEIWENITKRLQELKSEEY